MKTYVKRVMATVMTISCFAITVMAASAEETKTDAQSIQSKGKIEYDKDSDGTPEVKFDAQDMSNLAKGVDSINSNVKTLSAKYQDLANTAIAGKKSVITEFNNMFMTNIAVDSPFVGTGSIVEGIDALNSPPENTVFAIENNLSKGTAALIPGKGWVTGNGADNDSSYAKGYTDGLSHVSQGTITYYLVHQHTGDSTSGGGCYTKSHIETRTRTFTTQEWGWIPVAPGSPEDGGNSDGWGEGYKTVTHTENYNVTVYDLGCDHQPGDFIRTTTDYNSVAANEKISKAEIVY